jgi:ribosome biogenesis GTPase
MLHFDFDRLHRVGLTTTLAERARVCAADLGDELELLRVTSVHRETVQLHDGAAETSARPLPRLAHELLEAGTALAVGDWVLASRDASGQRWVRQRVPPSSHIARRDDDGSRHAVVSNVDHALLVMGLDDDFNPRRLERYLALAHASGVAPIVVDATDPASAASFAHVADGGRTLVLLGSSGAGKSTLSNTLMGAAVQDTGAVREHDGRGMHTTTVRSLHRLSGGACVIDTPGLRTLRPDVDEATLAASFEDIEKLSAQCRFRDCTHGGEPGCAAGEGVDPDRLRNFQKLLRESRRDTLTWVERRQQLSAWKSRGREARVRMKMKRSED